MTIGGCNPDISDRPAVVKIETFIILIKNSS